MNTEFNKQDILLKDRSYLKISGVVDVLSFDENGIIIETCNGSLSVDGEGLHIKNLSVEDTGGELEVDGKIGGVFFFEKTEKKRSFFGRKS